MLTRDEANEILRLAARFADTAVAAHSAKVSAETMRQFDSTGAAMGPAALAESDALSKRILAQEMLTTVVERHVEK